MGIVVRRCGLLERLASLLRDLSKSTHKTVPGRWWVYEMMFDFEDLIIKGDGSLERQ